MQRINRHKLSLMPQLMFILGVGHKTILILKPSNYQHLQNSNIVQMEKESWEHSIEKLLAELDIQVEDYEGGEAQKKKIKKRFKKLLINEKDKSEEALEKAKKLLQEVYKTYEAVVLQESKVQQLKSVVNKNRTEKQQSLVQLKMIENLQKGFKAKYDESLGSAKEVEKQQEQKRKKLIEELQQRIKVVQQEYQEAGKVKIQKIKENQMLRHEINKLEPQILTTESLYDAQLKKKQIQMEIQMTTMKQKIEMMSNFKNVGVQTKEKLEKASITNEKIQARVQILGKKEEEHKILLTKAHLILQDYKASLTKINEILRKKDKEVIESKQKLQKGIDAMEDIEAKLIEADKQQENQKDSIKMLLTLEQKLQEELAQ